MNLCDSDHEEVCYKGSNCPCCTLLDKVDALQGEIEDLKNEVEDLSGQVSELESTVKQLEAEQETEDS